MVVWFSDSPTGRLFYGALFRGCVSSELAENRCFCEVSGGCVLSTFQKVRVRHSFQCFRVLRRSKQLGFPCAVFRVFVSSDIAKSSAICNTVFRICISSDNAKKRMCSGTVFRVSCPAAVAENTLIFLHGVQEAILVIWSLCRGCLRFMWSLFPVVLRHLDIIWTFCLSLHLLYGRYLATVFVVWGGSRQ